MNLFALSGFINGISGAIFGGLVFFKNPKRLINRTFGLMTLSLVVWSFSYGFWLLSREKQLALFWVHLLSLGSTFIPITFLHWILTLLDLQKRRKTILIIGYIFTFFLASFSFSSFYIKNIKPQLFFPWWPEPGPLYHVYLVFGYLGMVGYACYELLKVYKTSRGHVHEQIKYILLAIGIGFGGGATNFPLWYGIPFPPYGNFLVFLYPFILAYAIARYRLMNIRFVLGRGAIYVFSFLAVIGVGFLLIFLNNQLAQPISFNTFFPLLIIIAILLFKLLFWFFEKLASKYFYYTFYSYQKVLTELGKRLTQVLDLKRLATLITSTLIRTMKLDRTVILLREPETGDYKIIKNIGFREENGISLVKDNFLTRYLEKSQKPLVYEEINLLIRDTKDEKEKRNLERLKENMKKIEAVLCLPLLREGKIIGLIVLGNKISRDSYSQQDLELLTTLSSQASIALDNARLYDQIKDFSQLLQEKVEEKTKELRKAYEELKTLDKAKSEFISMASHQLRTPLTSIKGYISMILEGDYGQIPQKTKKALENVFQSNARLIRIVNDLLNISRIELGKMEFQKSPTKIEELIQICYEEIKLEAQKKNLKLVFKKPKTPLPMVNIDPLKIQQVILNLLDNALRYTKKGKIEIALKKKPNSILISVKDTGEGLTKSEQKQIFEGFSRGSAGINLFIEGAGLGLYVAKKYLDLHKGKIWAESPGKGRGSTFYVELPIK